MAQSLTARIVWVIVVLACALIALFFTDKVVSEYVARQTTTLITFKRAKQLELPVIVVSKAGVLGVCWLGIEVCPKNPDAIVLDAVKREIRARIPFLSDEDAVNLISYAIAGSGMANMDSIVSKWQPLQIQRLHSLFLRWKGSRDYLQFYNDLFFRHGYKCKDLFHSCYIGYDKFDCCDKFQPRFVMLRGKCYRMIAQFQTAPDVHGRIALLIKQLPSPIVESSKKQPQAIVFLTDNHTDTSTFPRFYVNENESVFVRFVARLLRMSPWESECSMLDEDKGRATCYVKKYHEYRVLGPLNCSLFYLHHRVQGYDVCEPLRIVYNYNVVVNGAIGFVGERCLPHCHRWYHEFKIYRSDITQRFKPTNETIFRFESGFTNLEVYILLDRCRCAFYSTKSTKK
uniref:Beta-galactosidase n=1 Tax=Bursaphelenchus xylophilus TaxID=6326 RepID=A0A1I7S9N7_BURXY